MSRAAVLADLAGMNGNKAKLMQKYSDEQRRILNSYGGNLSDIPMSQDNPYHKLQDKIEILSRLE